MLSIGKLKHIHIIGCARTGTTMLHYAMARYDGIILIDRETSVTVDPSLIKTTNSATMQATPIMESVGICTFNPRETKNKVTKKMVAAE